MRRFGLSVLAILLLLSGVLLVILGTSELFSLDALGLPLPAETPGFIVMALGGYVLFRAGRHVRNDGQDHDPESHLAFTRDVRDDLDSMNDDDDDDRD
jgi:hypothetical protein